MQQVGRFLSSSAAQPQLPLAVDDLIALMATFQSSLCIILMGSVGWLATWESSCWKSGHAWISVCWTWVSLCQY
jgi:hypothetical protein